MEEASSTRSRVLELSHPQASKPSARGVETVTGLIECVVCSFTPVSVQECHSFVAHPQKLLFAWENILELLINSHGGTTKFQKATYGFLENTYVTT